MVSVFKVSNDLDKYSPRHSIIKDCLKSDVHHMTSQILFIGRRQANLCFHFAGSAENLPDITKSRDASLDNDLLALSSRS